MNWEEKLDAIQHLGETVLRMRAPGDWYVSQSGVESTARGSAVLRGEYGDGTSPEAAVLHHWNVLTVHDGNTSYLVLNATDETKRRHVYWNGFMWKDAE